MTPAQQDPNLATLMPEIQAAEAVLAANVTAMHVYIGQGDLKAFARLRYLIGFSPLPPHLSSLLGW